MPCALFYNYIFMNYIPTETTLSVFFVRIRYIAIEMSAKVSLRVPASDPFTILYTNQHTHTGIERYLRSRVFLCQLAIVAKIAAINGSMLQALSQVRMTLPVLRTIKIAGIILF